MASIGAMRNDHFQARRRIRKVRAGSTVGRLQETRRRQRMGMRGITRRRATAAVGLLGWGARAFAQTSGEPIRIGSTLALTGALSATAQIHKLVGELYIEQANKRGGWLGRPLEWVLKDDQSKP